MYPPNEERKGVKRVEEYEQLALLDFTSKRKRMTVLIRTPDNKVKIYCKGADSMIQPLLRGAAEGRLGQAQPNWDFTVSKLQVYVFFLVLLFGVRDRGREGCGGMGAAKVR